MEKAPHKARLFKLIRTVFTVVFVGIVEFITMVSNCPENIIYFTKAQFAGNAFESNGVQPYLSNAITISADVTVSRLPVAVPLAEIHFDGKTTNIEFAPNRTITHKNKPPSIFINRVILYNIFLKSQHKIAQTMNFLNSTSQDLYALLIKKD